MLAAPEAPSDHAMTSWLSRPSWCLFGALFGAVAGQAIGAQLATVDRDVDPYLFAALFVLLLANAVLTICLALRGVILRWRQR